MSDLPANDIYKGIIIYIDSEIMILQSEHSDTLIKMVPPRTDIKRDEVIKMSDGKFVQIEIIMTQKNLKSAIREYKYDINRKKIYEQKKRQAKPPRDPSTYKKLGRPRKTAVVNETIVEVQSK